MSLYLDFYGVGISVSGEEGTIDKLGKDFSFFKNSGVCAVEIFIDIKCSNPDYSILNGKRKSWFKHREFSIYKDKQNRIIDFNRIGLAIHNIIKKTVEISSLDLDFLHEIAYLTVLSFVGEELEKQGLYRIHGACLSIEKHGVLLLAPTEGGKTTFVLNFLESENARFFSDDVTLITKDLEIKPFPVRIGVKESDKNLINNIPEEYLYSLKRRKYGNKRLVDTRFLYKKISSSFKLEKVIILNKNPDAGFAIKNISKFSIFIHIFKNFVIGMGLPQLIVFMNLNFNIFDIFRLSVKALKRLMVMFRIIINTESFRMNLSSDIKKNGILFLDSLGIAHQ